MIAKKNNKGFTLVEVIVSMLVLSIVISSVLTAFSLSAKANAKTKKVQNAESLMEDLLELAGAVKDSSQYANKVASLFAGTKTVTQALSDTAPIQTVEICEVRGISKGSYTYDVEIIRDTKPAEYDTMNTTSVISFGASGSKSILINASTKGTLFLEGDTENGYDKMALDEYVDMRNSKIREDNLALDPDVTPTPEIDANVMTPAEYTTAINEIKSKIDRDVYLETVWNATTGKMQLVAYFSYEADDSLDLMTGADRILEYPFFYSGEFNKAGDTSTGAERIERVYLLYSPAEGHWETSAENDCDIRIYDKDELLAADVFVVCQENTLQDIDSDLVGKDLSIRFNSAPTIRISFAKRGEGVTAEAPARVDLYCPAEISVGVVSNVTAHSYQMIAESEEIRVQELTITIKDSDGNEVASEVVACLQ